MKNVFKIILCFFGILIFFINSVLILKSIIFPNEVPSFFGNKPYIVMSGSIQTDVEFGDFVIVNEFSAIKQNDIVVVKTENRKATTYSVNQIKNGMLKLENDTGDLMNLSENSIEGKVIIQIGVLGEIFLFLQNPIVILFVLIIIILVNICVYKYKLLN